MELVFCNYYCFINNFKLYAPISFQHLLSSNNHFCHHLMIVALSSQVKQKLLSMPSLIAIHALFDHFIQNHKLFRSLSKLYQLWSYKIEWVSSLFFIIKITFVLNKTQWSNASAFVLCSIDSEHSYLCVYIYNSKMYAFSFQFALNNKDAEYAHRVHCTVCSRSVSFAGICVCIWISKYKQELNFNLQLWIFVVVIVFAGVCISFDLNNTQIWKHI